MAIGIWVKRSLRHYRARHLLFAGTAALASGVLCAALLTGESLRQGLERGLRARLGPVRSAVLLTEGVFPAALARRLPETRAALLLKGELLDAAGAVCADRAQVIGVAGDRPGAADDAGLSWLAALNGRGREAVPGGEGSVRFERPSLYSVEMPLAALKEERLLRRAVRLGGADGQGLPADFALRAASVPPVNVFLPHAALAEAAGVPGMANLLASARPAAELEQALRRALTPEDLGLVVEDGGGAGPSTLVKSRRVFLPADVLQAVGGAGLQAAPALFHLADAFEAGTNATPYGFVAAVTPGRWSVPADLGDDEIVVNAWLAETLGLQTNQTLTLRWRRFEAGGRLVADSRAFRVRAVMPAERAADVKAAMPVFPGLAGVDSCAAWDVGMPMDPERLKDAANEAYWKRWRETPKAFLTFAAGTACFGTAFGGAMSVEVAADGAAVRRALESLAPAQAGFAVRPAWEEGVKAAQGSTDFRMLFAGMAFVLMAAALLLSSLALALALETRKGEVALLGALGWSRGRVVRLLAAEWGVPLLLGALAGAALGAALARALVWGLQRFWSGAFAGASLGFHFSWPAAGAAAGLSAGLTALVLLRTVGVFARVPPAVLWGSAGNWKLGAAGAAKGGTLWESLLGGALAVGALAAMALSPRGSAAEGTFFGAGFLLMLSLMLFAHTAAAAWTARAGGVPLVGPARAGVCRALASPRRSATVVVLLAVGAFLTVGILSMKHDPAAGCERPSSGSGGFAALVTSVAPLDRERGLELARKASGAKGVVPVRVHEGDEAGCLNLNQPVAPRVVGLDARAMARARAFEPADAGGVWTPLEARLPDGTIPALAADRTMLQYSLKAKAGAADGTVYAYPGTAARVRIVGALPVRSGILQGAVIVDEKFFAELFPAEAGYRLWLCDYAPYLLRDAAEAGGVPPGGESSVLQLRHPAPGVTVETAQERLRLLGSVESAYLDMFLVLGGLGVVLGVMGIALVILRGVEERRGELALLGAVGLPRRTVTRLLAAEYGVLVGAGLLCGAVPALAAVRPAARAMAESLPWLAMGGILAAMVASAALCVALAAGAASRRFGPEVLKEEV